VTCAAKKRGNKRKSVNATAVNATLLEIEDSGPLHSAAAAGDTAAIKTLLESGSFPGGNHSELPNGPTPLFMAAGGCHAEAAQLLLSTGSAFPEARVKNGSTALHRVAEINCTNLDIWKVLVEGGVPVNISDGYLRTVLHEAAAANHAGAVALLAGTGKVNVSAIDGHGFSSLLHAVRLGAFEALEALLKVGASALDKGPTGGDALHTAAYEGKLEMVQRMLKLGCALNGLDAKNFTPVMWAARQGRMDVVKFLVDSGANLHAEGDRSWSPMLVAAHAGKDKMVKYFLSKGVAPGGGDPMGVTALIHASRSGHLEMVRELIRAGATLTVSDDIGGTAVHYAAFEGRSEILKVLLAAGASPNTVTEDGHSPLVSSPSAIHESKTLESCFPPLLPQSLSPPTHVFMSLSLPPTLFYATK